MMIAAVGLADVNRKENTDIAITVKPRKRLAALFYSAALKRTRGVLFNRADYNIKNAMAKQVDQNMLKTSLIFLLRGGMDYGKLSLKHKAMMNMLYRS